MKSFDNLPKTIKKTVRYITQDVQSFEKLEHIEKMLIQSIANKKYKLQNSTNEIDENKNSNVVPK
ncbi:LytR family transcriptional regulator [Ectobacillus sp. sgz5001026]|uniref:LytR family transcriptional regulator n=1 Tax=Ectobacillus sp. sgz5001026 TaxID=3242473 RepID=UPI0036D3B5D1